MKKIFKAIIALFIIVVLNTCYYVLIGQKTSNEKLDKGQDLNIYECCSIYTTHLIMCCVGYPIAPEAARECFKLHTTKKDTVYFTKFDFSDSQKLKKAFSQLKERPYGSSVKLSWNGNKDYSPFSPEHRLAIAVNPCVLKKECHLDYEHFYDEDLYTITTSTQYPKKSMTEFDCKKFKIIINEGLFRYLQDKGWLKTYTAVYQYYYYSQLYY